MDNKFLNLGNWPFDPMNGECYQGLQRSLWTGEVALKKCSHHLKRCETYYSGIINYYGKFYVGLLKWTLNILQHFIFHFNRIKFF